MQNISTPSSREAPDFEDKLREMVANYVAVDLRSKISTDREHIRQGFNSGYTDIPNFCKVHLSKATDEKERSAIMDSIVRVLNEECAVLPPYNRQTSIGLLCGAISGKFGQYSDKPMINFATGDAGYILTDELRTENTSDPQRARNILRSPSDPVLVRSNRIRRELTDALKKTGWGEGPLAEFRSSDYHFARAVALLRYGEAEHIPDATGEAIRECISALDGMHLTLSIAKKVRFESSFFANLASVIKLEPDDLQNLQLLEKCHKYPWQDKELEPVAVTPEEAERLVKWSQNLAERIRTAYPDVEKL